MENAVSGRLRSRLSGTSVGVPSRRCWSRKFNLGTLGKVRRLNTAGGLALTGGWWSLLGHRGPVAREIHMPVYKFFAIDVTLQSGISE